MVDSRLRRRLEDIEERHDGSERDLVAWRGPGHWVSFLAIWCRTAATASNRILLCSPKWSRTTSSMPVSRRGSRQSRARRHCDGRQHIIKMCRRRLSESQPGPGSAFLEFKHDYNVGDPVRSLRPLARCADEVRQHPIMAPIKVTGGCRSVPIALRSFTVDMFRRTTSSVTFTGPITFTSTPAGSIQNKMHLTTGGMLIWRRQQSNTITCLQRRVFNERFTPWDGRCQRHDPRLAGCANNMA